MLATASRTANTQANPAAKPKVLPPPRAFAPPSRNAALTFVRQGAAQAPADKHQRFRIPDLHRRTASLDQVSATTRAREDVNISVNGIPNLPLPENAEGFHASIFESRRRTLRGESDPWHFAGKIEDLTPNDAASMGLAPSDSVDVTIQFAQLSATHNVAPPVRPLHRPAGAPVASHSLKRFDGTSITTGGAPLPVAIRNPLARTFSIDLTPIRVHTGPYAQKIVRTLSTRAFAYGNNIFLGSGEQPTDLRLMAHEVAHVVQQSHGATLQHYTIGSGDACEREAEQASAAAVRGDSFTVQQQSTARPQGYGLGDLASDLGIPIPDPLDWLANKANVIPGFRMFTIVLGMNPINMSSVDRSAANILRALIEFMPGGGLITQALDNSGVFEKAGAFVETQIESLGMTGAAIKAAVTQFIAGLSLKRIVTEPGTVWAEAERIFTEPIDRIISFAKGLVNGIIELIKDAILKPIAKLAEGTEGYNLLKGILGKDPITGEAVTPSAETLLGPLLNMIGLGDVWQKMQQAKAIPRAWAWFQTTMSQLFGFVSQIPDLFIAAFKSLTIEDIILVPLAFAKLAGVFGGFIGKFVSWGVDAMFKLLEIVFDVVNPKAFGYVKQTGAALKSILQNPLPFVGNLVNAAKTGFVNFGKNFVNHLKKGLIDWLTGSLDGVYIPKALSLIEFGKLALSILGITWGQIRGKIIKALGPAGATIMAGLEAAFDVIMALKDGGPAAAWEVIKDKLTSLKDTIVSGIISFVVEAVVTKAVPKLIAMFIPGAGFISAIISIWDIIKVFIEKIQKIWAVVTAFTSSIVAIAAGNIGAAAAKVESVLGGILSLAISFFAGFVGLGKVSTKVREVINKIRAPVDKAIDTAINFIISKAKKLFASLFSGKKDAKPDKRSEQEKQKAVDSAIQEANALLEGHKVAVEDLPKPLKTIQNKHKLTTFQIVKQPAGESKEKVSVHAELNPKGDTRFIDFVHGMPRKDLAFVAGSYDRAEYSRQIKDQETGLRGMKIPQWLTNRDAFLARAASSDSGRHPGSESAQKRARGIVISALVIAEINAQIAAGKTPDKAAIRADVNSRFPGTAVLHAPDQVAGGEFDKFAIDINQYADKKKLKTGAIVMAEKQAKKILGNLEINSSIGSQWGKGRAADLDTAVRAHKAATTPTEFDKQNVNARLSVS